jgi:hypothetical protein
VRRPPRRIGRAAPAASFPSAGAVLRADLGYAKIRIAVEIAILSRRGPKSHHHPASRNAQHRTNRISWLGGIGLRTRVLKSPQRGLSQEMHQGSMTGAAFLLPGHQERSVFIAIVSRRASCGATIRRLPNLSPSTTWGCFLLWSVRVRPFDQAGIGQGAADKPLNEAGDGPPIRLAPPQRLISESTVGPHQSASEVTRAHS